jgi:hypothetical protein
MTEAVPLSEELLRTMRNAAKKAIELREPFITPRALLLALLDDGEVGPALRAVVNREKVLAADAEANYGVTRILEEEPDGEEPAMARYDTLAFKTPDGRTSVWLARDAYSTFLEGARRVEERYQPKHLALGLAAQAVLAPGVLAAIRVEPGVFADAVYKI